MKSENLVFAILCVICIFLLGYYFAKKGYPVALTTPFLSLKLN